jgi:branched-chain amino acid transport system ATP-binding protein
VTADAPLLDARGLSAFYGRAQVLFGVSLALRAGEVVALLGRNGAGKSTTLKAVMGLVAREAERLVFAGRPIAHCASYKIARLGLGYVPEERRVFTDLTVDENLEVGRQAARRGRAPWTPERLFAIFPNLAEMRTRRVDEPSEGLAPVIVELMAQAIAAMRGDGIAVLLSEQNLPFAASVSDRAYVIEKGQLRYEGSIEELSRNEALRDDYLTV